MNSIIAVQIYRARKHPLTVVIRNVIVSINPIYLLGLQLVLNRQQKAFERVKLHAKKKKKTKEAGGRK